MKRYFLLFLLCLASVAFSQDSSFQLKDYKYRTPGFRALSVDLNFSGAANDSKFITMNKSTNRSFTLTPSQITYTKIISTNKRLHQSDFTLRPWAYFSTSTQNNQASSQDHFQSDFRWDRTDRFYNNGLWFFEFGNLLDASFSGSRGVDATKTIKSSTPQFQNTASVGFGKGRIERVQDAQMALYILNDLKAQGLLDADVTPGLAASFAKLITDINNRRVFDSRRRRIYELTRIDSFLKNSGLVGKTDIRHFTTVNDDWAFAINPYRQAGKAWFARLKPVVGYAESNYDERFVTGGFSQDKSSHFLLALLPQIGIEKYVPLNLRWQQNTGASLSYQLSHGRRKYKTTSPSGTMEAGNSYNDWEAKFTGFWGVGYFPNTRTQLGGNLFMDVSYYNDRTVAVSPELTLFANYFIGYRTYLTANGYLRYDYNHNNLIGNYHQLAASLGFTFSHILF